MIGIKNIVIVILSALCLYFFLNQNVIDKVVEKTTIKTEITQKTDTIYMTVFKPSKIKYISRIKDSIVYVDTKDSLSIKVNEYNEVIKNENSIARVTILTTGELKGLFGTITTQDKKTTVTTLKKVFVRKSNIYIGGSVLKSNNSDIDFMVTGDYVIKNKFILGVGYSPFNKSIALRAAFKAF